MTGRRALLAALGLLATLVAVPVTAAAPPAAGAVAAADPAPEVVTIGTEPPSPAYVGATWRPGATSDASTAGAPRVPVVTVAATPAGACTVARPGGIPTVTLAAVGSCTVTATVAADAAFTGDTDERVVTIGRRPREVTIEEPAAGTTLRVGTPWTPVTSADPSGTITLSASPDTRCTASGTSVTLLLPGACRVTASVAQTTGVEGGEDAVDVTIERRTRSVSVASATGLRAGTTWDPSVTSVPTGPATFTTTTATVCVPTEDGSQVRLLTSGSCSVVATVAQDATTEAGTSAARTVTVGKQTRTVTLPAPTATLYADTVWNPGATTTGTGVPTYTVSPGNSTTCQPSTDGTRVRLLRSGTCTVTATVAADATHEADSSAARQVSVLAQVPTLTFAVLPVMPRWTDLVTVMVTATDADGDRVAGSGFVRVAGVDTADPAATTWTNGQTTRTFTGSGAGAVDVTASFTPTQTTVYAATSRTEPVTLGRATQTASFGTPTDEQRYVGERWPGAASLSSGLTPVLDAKTDACTVTGNAVDFTASGTCTVGASHPGTTDYEPATEVTTDVVVRKRPVRLTASVSASPTVGRPVTITARASDLLRPAASADPVPGVFTFVVPGQDGTTAQATPAAGAATYTYTPTQDGTQQVTVQFTPAADQAARFAAPADVSAPVSIVAAPQEVTFDAAQLPPVRYVDESVDLVLGGTAGGGALSLEVDTAQTPVACSVSGFTVTWTREGSCHLIGRQAAVPRVYAADSLPIEISVTRVPVDVRATVTPSGAAAGADGRVGEVVEVRAAARDKDQVLVDGTGTLGVERRTGPGTWVTVAERASSAWNRGTRLLTFTPANAGTYRVVEGFVPGNGVRFAVRRTGAGAVALPEFTVLPGAQVIRFVSPRTSALVDESWVPAYAAGGSTSDVVVSVTDDKPDAVVCTTDGTSVAFTSVGTCTVTLSQDGDADYDAATPVSQDVVVNRAPTTVTVAPSAATAATVGTPLVVVVRAAGPGGSLVPGSFVVDLPGVGATTIAAPSGRIEVAWTPTTRGVQTVSAAFTATQSEAFADSTGSASLTVLPGTQTIVLRGTAPTGARVGDRFDPAVEVIDGPQDPLVPSVVLGTEDEAVCVVDGRVVLLTGPGRCVVTARAVAFPVGSSAPDWAQSALASTGFDVVRNGVSVTLDAPGEVQVGLPGTATVTVVGSRADSPPVVPGTVSLAAVSQATNRSTVLVVDAPLDAAGAVSLDFTIRARDAYDLVATFTPTDRAAWSVTTATQDLDAVLQTQNVLAPELPVDPVVFSSWLSPNLTDAGLPVQVSAIDSAGVCTVVAGTGSRRVSFDGAGTCTLRFTAVGDQTYEDAGNSFEEEVVVARTPSRTVLTVDGVTTPDGLTVGETSRLRALVTATGPADGPAATGEVIFEETGAGAPAGPPRIVAAVPLVAGRAETPWLPLRGGDRVVSARFVPDTASAVGYDASTATLDPTVALAPMTSAVTVTHRPATPDPDDVVVSATVAPVRSAAGPATGSVVLGLDNGRTLGTVPLTGGTARLVTTIDADRAVAVLADFAGDADHLATGARVVRGVPTLMVRTDPAEATRGWNGSAVRVEFSCRAAGSALVEPCPRTVVLDDDAAEQAVSRTVVAEDGGRATARVAGIDVDLTPPSVTIVGARDGQDFRGRSPVTRCRARDTTSGVSRCRFSRSAVNRDTVRLTATATDGAGHRTTSSVLYRQLQEWVVDAPLDRSGRFRVSGRRVQVRALSPRERPQLMLPRAGGGWRPGPALVPTSIRDGVITWYVDHRLPAGRADTRLGIRVAGQKIRVLRIDRR